MFGLKPEIPFPYQVLDHFKDWVDTPETSVIFIDEVQEFTRDVPTNCKTEDLPSWMTLLEKHRHEGKDILSLLSIRCLFIRMLDALRLSIFILFEMVMFLLLPNVLGVLLNPIQMTFRKLTLKMVVQLRFIDLIKRF